MQKIKSQSSSNNAIGVFDSGVGGTSIWKEIHSLLPNENSIYLADSKNAPYGIKSKADIIALCEKNVELLLQDQCKIIIVACNTATTIAIKHLRTKYAIPFIGIEPAIKPASLKTKTKNIGILATKGTLASELFQETTSIYSQGIEVLEQDGTGIVELIENGKLYSIEMKILLQEYLNPMIEAKIDHLVLGCSHYPYLIPILKEILPKEVKIIDSGRAVARQTKTVLEAGKLLNRSTKLPKLHFYTNGSKPLLESLIGSKFRVENKFF
ncbi:MAG: glutamate racemase [Flavobacteriales bacterium]|nr:glutamate racemase [Flavobacteriales bacterium]